MQIYGVVDILPKILGKFVCFLGRDKYHYIKHLGVRAKNKICCEYDCSANSQIINVLCSMEDAALW